MDINQIIGQKGGRDETYWEIVGEEGRGTTKYWPSIKDGQQLSVCRVSLEEYLAHKVERERETIRMTVAGNPISAEEPISKMLGCKCLAVGPHSLDIYVEEVMQ